MATQSLSTDPAIALSLRTTYTTPLLAEIKVGSLVKASHMTAIGNFINAIPLHTHTLTEYLLLDTGGNTAKTTSAIRTTSASPSSGVVVPTPAVGSTIAASVTNVLVNGVNGVRVHTHTFSDDDGQ